jgi:hypothetical protein
MFSSKPAYTPDELANYISRIETLERLRDKALQNSRLIKDDHYMDEYLRYTENIRVAQQVLNVMLQKVNK